MFQEIKHNDNEELVTNSSLDFQILNLLRCLGRHTDNAIM